MKCKANLIAVILTGYCTFATPLMANLMTVTSIARDTQAGGSGPGVATSIVDHPNNNLSPSDWNDDNQQGMSGNTDEVLPWAYQAEASQISDFSEANGLFGVDLFTIAGTSYLGFEDPAQAAAFTDYGPNFTITQPLNYSFTATSTGNGPASFYLYFEQDSVAIFNGFAASGSGTLQPGDYNLFFSLLDQSYTSGNGSSGNSTSGLLFTMTLSPVPEPPTLLLASAGLLALVLSSCRHRAPDPILRLGVQMYTT